MARTESATEPARPSVRRLRGHLMAELEFCITVWGPGCCDDATSTSVNQPCWYAHVRYWVLPRVWIQRPGLWDNEIWKPSSKLIYIRGITALFHIPAHSEPQHVCTPETLWWICLLVNQLICQWFPIACFLWTLKSIITAVRRWIRNTTYNQSHREGKSFSHSPLLSGGADANHCPYFKYIALEES